MVESPHILYGEETRMTLWLDRQRRECLRQKIIAGCEAMADIYLATEREYHPLEEEVQRGLDTQYPITVSQGGDHACS